MIKITNILRLITILYIETIWFILGLFCIPLFCLTRGMNKILDCLNEYAKDFTDQYNNINKEN